MMRVEGTTGGSAEANAASTAGITAAGSVDDGSSDSRRRRWQRAAAIGVLAFAAVSAAIAVNAVNAQGEHGAGPGGRGAGSGMALFGAGPEHMARMMDHLLDGLGASDAQRNQIRQIAMAAAVDLKAQREAGRGLRVRAAQIFTAPAVDASAAEALRQQMLTQQDQSSKRIMEAMLDISRVLTPEQRARLGERLRDRQAVMQDRMQRMERMPRGGASSPPAPPR